MNPRWRLAAASCALTALAGCGTTVAPTGLPSYDGGLSGQPTPGATGPEDQPTLGSMPTSSATGPEGRAAALQPGRAASTTGAAQSPTVAATLPRSGPGWDARHVYIGVSTADDAKQYVAAMGYELPIGDARSMTQAIVADVNAHGGVLGRQLVAVFRDHSTANLAANPQLEAQADCAYFSSDKRVVAYFDSTLGQSSGIAACMHQARIPFFDLNSALHDDSDFRQFGPYLWRVRFPDINRLIPLWVARLRGQGYFTGWDNVNGAPGNKPVRVGLYLEDNPLGHRIATRLTSALAMKATDLSMYFYAGTVGQNDASSAVLQFRADDVTHVLTLPSAAGAWGLFQVAAENQHYRPRYGLTSYNWMQFHVENLPATQLVGSMGVGWLPDWDVDSAHQPRGLTGQARCVAAMRRAKQEAAARAAAPGCDAFFLLADGANAAGGLLPDALRAGIIRLGPVFKPAGTFRSGLSASHQAGLPGAVRDVAFNSSCSCYVYGRGDHPL